jgi:hypothetical protein
MRAWGSTVGRSVHPYSVIDGVLDERKDIPNKAACLKKQEPCYKRLDAAERHHFVQA